MEAQRLPCPLVSLDDQPLQLSCLQAVPAASHLSVNPVVLQPEQAPSQTIYLKTFTLPLYQSNVSECRQPNHKLPTGQTNISLDSTRIPLIVNPHLHSERTDQLQAIIQKQPGTINIVSGLPVLPQNSSLYTPLGSPGKSKSAGKYLCKHCGRDCLKPSVLEKHMRSHTGERPFPCTTCGTAFKTQSNLYKHRRTQTHVNNARLPSEPDSSSPLEENEKVTESVESPQRTKANDGSCDHPRTMIKQANSESTSVVTNEKHPLDASLPAMNASLLISESQWVTTDNSYHGGANQSLLETETTKDSANLLQRRKIQEQISPTVSKHSQLQRQQATYSEKLWDSRSPDYKLKKCESTDSGYLSRSDSVEQQMLSPGPLHSLCEHSTESESDTGISNLRCSAGNSSKVDSAGKATGALTLEKKKLEEHISKLISHNKAVVDDTQLDNVRPRKTILSKQGSIDLPMPYTYKDSFHFDIRPPDLNRKKNLSLFSAKSIFTPMEKPKPLFFHSVPTQFSTTIDCIPVTRSNSLPFIEGTKRIQDRVDSSKYPSFSRISPNTSFSGLLHSNNFAASMTDIPNSHPRALVRQVAVDDLPLSHVTESSPSLEEMKGTKKLGTGGEGANTKYKKPNQRKLKMFSQEKWQVYGDETFKKIYQKMKSNQTAKKQKGNKGTDISDFHSDTKETASHEGLSLPRDGKSPTIRNLVSSPVAISAKQNTKEPESCSIGSPILQRASSQENSSSYAESMETSFSVGGREHSGATETFLVHGCRELCVSKQDPTGSDQVLSFSTDSELRLKLQQATDQDSATVNITSHSDNGSEETCVQGEFIKCLPLNEVVSSNKGEDTSGKESFQLALVALPPHHCNSSEPVQTPQKLPSERKKLKVDKVKSKENATLKTSLGPSSSAERIVKLLDCYTVIDKDAPESIDHSVKGENQTAVVGANASSTSMEYEEAVQPTVMTSNNKNYVAGLTDTASGSAVSFSEHRTEGTKEYTCNSFVLQRLTQKPCPTIMEKEMSSKSGDMATVPTPTHLAFDQVTPHLKKNDFLPKYILKYSQEGNSTIMPLILAGEPENKPCVSLPGTLTDSPCSASNTRSVASPSDTCLCPLQLEWSHPTRAEELKWDARTTWKSLVACPPAILETTSITTSCHLQSARQHEKMKSMWKGAPNRDSLGDQKSAQEGHGHTIVCTSHTPGKKLCFTTMYTGGFFISSDMTGRSSALQLIHSGNSSVISVSSLVERTVLCRNTEEELKEWQSDVNSFPGFQGLPTCSVGNSKSICHSSDKLYCHVLCTQEKEVHILPQLSVVSHVGNSKVPKMHISFPTLNVEPQLTWCCLNRNLPLPVEQKEIKDSAYSALHTAKHENVVSKCTLSFCKMKNTRKASSKGLTTRTPEIPTSSFPQRQQIEKVMSLLLRKRTDHLYFSTPGVDGLFKNVPEPEKAKENLLKMRGLTTNNAKRNRKRKKVKFNSKRCSYGHRHILLKTNRLSKQQRAKTRTSETPKKHSHPHTSDSREHCIKCLCLPTAFQGNDQNVQQETSHATTDKATSPVKKNQMNEDVSRSTDEHSSISISLQRIAAVPDVPRATYSCPLVSNASMQKASNFDDCPLGILQKEPQPAINSDHCWPSSGTCNFEFKDVNKSHPHNLVDSQVTSPIFVGSKADCNNMESENQHFTLSKSSVDISEREEQSTDKDLYPSLKEQLTSTLQTPYPVLLTSKLLTEISVSSNLLPGSLHVQEINSSSGYLRCTDKNHHSMKADNSQEKICKPGFPTSENPSAFQGPGTLSKSYKKQSLEMMNKQSHVEYDDTSSSDDEDRLIIEI
ncbi:zinc finger protein 831 [Elgaria multicarinata webbii]|uniref:zinc finger protein 831 n=1 Tax=Elgaria multicarinata webbii TaxID=159646 RepID=UPI002FCD5A04